MILQEAWAKSKTWSLPTRIIAGAGVVLISFILIFYLYGKVSNWLHNKRYEQQKAAADEKAAAEESAGDKKVGGADELHKRLDELEKKLPEIERAIKDANEKAEEAARQSETTRTVYREKIRAPVRQRVTGTAVDDATLRADIERAKQAINRNRTAPAIERQP